MNVNRSQIDGIINVYKANVKQSKDKKSNNSGNITGKYKDKVTFSSDAKQLQELIKNVSLDDDDIRVKKVELLKQKINSGTYNIDGELVAQKIIEESKGTL